MLYLDGEMGNDVSRLHGMEMSAAQSGCCKSCRPIPLFPVEEPKTETDVKPAN